MRTTWIYGTKTVVVEGGVVVSSDSGAFPAGQKADARRLKACGWRKVKAAARFDAWGRKFGADGEIERR